MRREIQHSVGIADVAAASAGVADPVRPGSDVYFEEVTGLGREAAFSLTEASDRGMAIQYGAGGASSEELCRRRSTSYGAAGTADPVGVELRALLVHGGIEVPSSSAPQTRAEGRPEVCNKFAVASGAASSA